MAPKKSAEPPPPPSLWAPPADLTAQFFANDAELTHLRSGAFDVAHGKQMLTTPGKYRITYDIVPSADQNAPMHSTLARYGICVGVCDANLWTKGGHDAAFVDAQKRAATQARSEQATEIPDDQTHFSFPSHGHHAAWALELSSGKFLALTDAKRLADTSWSKGSDCFERLSRRSRLQPVETVAIEVDLPADDDVALYLRSFGSEPHPLARPPPAHMLGKFSHTSPTSKLWSYHRTPEQFMPSIARPSGRRCLRFSVNGGPYVEPSTTNVRLPRSLYPWVAMSFAHDKIVLRSAVRLDPE